MKIRTIPIALTLMTLIMSSHLVGSSRSDEAILMAQEMDDDLMFEDEEQILDAGLDRAEQEEKEREELKRREEEAKRLREEEEKKLKEEQAKKAQEQKRAAMEKRREREQRIEAAKAKELDALREASADTTEYTLEPSSVEMVVELEPAGYGFRQRSHRMVMSGEFDFLLRGRGVLHYDYRFFNHLSFGILAGLDWSALSLFNRFRQDLQKLFPKQLTVMGGLSAKWRLTEWYMRSSVFLEPSVIFGHMWQTLLSKESTYWRLRPGVFGGIETVFDSGLSLATRVGVEFPFDLGNENPVKEVAEPLFLFGIGFAI